MDSYVRMFGWCCALINFTRPAVVRRLFSRHKISRVYTNKHGIGLDHDHINFPSAGSIASTVTDLLRCPTFMKHNRSLSMALINLDLHESRSSFSEDCLPLD
jgi:hypothetical protein